LPAIEKGAEPDFSGKNRTMSVLAHSQRVGNPKKRKSLEISSANLDLLYSPDYQAILNIEGSSPERGFLIQAAIGPHGWWRRWNQTLSDFIKNATLPFGPSLHSGGFQKRATKRLWRVI
jgi:hypothetical protein